jgi:hypothetical protein
MNDTAFLERRKVPPPAPRTRSVPPTAAVLRIPVTPANRARLRRLRFEELQLWEAADARRFPTPGRLPDPEPDREGHAILVLLGGVALTALVQSTWAVSAFVQKWGAFRAFVRSLVG